MAFRREVDDRICLRNKGCDRIKIADICLDKPEPGVLPNWSKIAQVARIGQLVNDCDAGIWMPATKFRANALPMNPAPPVTSTWDKVRDFSGSVVADIEGLVCVFFTVSLHGAAPWSAPTFTRHAECASWCRVSPFRRACCRSGEHLLGDVAVVSTPPSARDFRSHMERVMTRRGFFACSHEHF